MTKYFKVPFSVSGNKTAIPDDLQPSGLISYTEGWTGDYELEQGVNPQAKDVSRQNTNQVYFDITELLKEIQEKGILPYRADVNYVIEARVVGNDGVVYFAEIINGPDTSIIDPVGDLTGTWFEENPNNAVQLTGGGPMSTSFVNQLQDSLTYDLPLAANFPSGKVIEVEKREIDKTNTPIVQRISTDLIEFSGGTDTAYTLNAVAQERQRFTSNGVDRWSI